MSLVGSLEDLGLGDILQIVGLSGKTGVLSVRSQAGEGRIVFEEGLIRSAWIKGRAGDLAELLAARRALDARELEAMAAEASSRRETLEAVLLARGALERERLDALRAEHVQDAVAELFAWSSGEFCFEMREPEAAEESPDLRLTPGLSPQRVALEGARRSDEEDREGEVAPAGESSEAERSEGSIARTAETPGPAPGEAPPVVVVDPDLAVLEWVKAALTPAFPRVHIFQRSDLGIARIHQYLARSEAPVVVLSQDAPPDPLSGAQGPDDIAARLATLAPQMPVVRLAEKAAAPDAGGAAQKPDARALHAGEAASELADRLRELLIDRCGRAVSAAGDA